MNAIDRIKKLYKEAKTQKEKEQVFNCVLDELIIKCSDTLSEENVADWVELKVKSCSQD